VYFVGRRRLTEEEKVKRLMRKPLHKLTAAERRLTGRLDIKRGRLPEELEAYFTQPKDANGRRVKIGWYPTGTTGRAKGNVRWSKQREFPLEKVPVKHRHIAERKFHEIMARKQARGIKITHQHIGSAWGNAVNYVKHVITGNTRRKVVSHLLRLNFWKALLKRRAREAQQAEINEFRDKPLVKRVKWGMT
jgi:hypothetical protein